MADFDPRYGEAVPVADGILRVTASNTGPFTGAGTNSYLIGDRTLILVDPGPDDDAHLAALERAVAGRTVSHIVLTHTHRDHVDGLAKALAMTGAETVGEGAYREARPLHEGEENPFRYASDTEFVPQIVVSHGDVVDNGDAALTVIATPGHAANHIALATGDVCLSGDHVMGWSTTVIAPPDGAMAPYLNSLDVLLERDDALYLPGHGGEIVEPRKAVSAMKSHRLMREGAVLDRLVKGDRHVSEIVSALYVGIDPRLAGAAGLSVLAHLEKLAEDGKAVADVSTGFGRDALWRAA